jgi:hypothetical protein
MEGFKLCSKTGKERTLSVNITHRLFQVDGNAKLKEKQTKEVML